MGRERGRSGEDTDPAAAAAKSDKKKRKKERKEEKKRRRGVDGVTPEKEERKEKKKKRKKRKLEKREKDGTEADGEEERRRRKKKRKSKEGEEKDATGVGTSRKKRSRPYNGDTSAAEGDEHVVENGCGGDEYRSDVDRSDVDRSGALRFDCRYILAPMVGASELAFRLLCRRYGATLAYTPMMSAAKFASDASYRAEEFQTVPEDRPLVCHFGANDPGQFAAAARLVEDRCDAIDLNLGCPQRTAFLGHFGSYLLGPDDRELVLSIVREGSRAVRVPIFVKIRLLDSVEETIELCRQLRDAGAALIAVHARYRASWERKGPGARDGPAMLDQVLEIKRAVPDIPIISNGNVIEYGDVVKNLEFTKADGVMSAEGILDNPALYLPRLGPNDGASGAKMVQVAKPSSLFDSVATNRIGDSPLGEQLKKRKRKLTKLLKEIGAIEEKLKSNGNDSIDDDQRKKLDKKSAVESELKGLLKKENEGATSNNELVKHSDPRHPATETVSLKKLYDSADDKLTLAKEYLDLARRYAVEVRSIVFHTRRMCRDLLNRYQLMADCEACKSMDEVVAVLEKVERYRNDPTLFRFDREKAAREKKALERKRENEAKRKRYEGRMRRKAIREGRDDAEYYVRLGAEVPTVELVRRMRGLPRTKQLEMWKVDHHQHCLSFHVEPNGCPRARTCAFLHVDAKGINTFDEREEVAG